MLHPESDYPVFNKNTHSSFSNSLQQNQVNPKLSFAQSVKTVIKHRLQARQQDRKAEILN